MKKVYAFLFFAALAVQVFASTPTVTVSLTATTPKYYVYTASFSTNISNVDSAYIYSTGTTPFSIEEIGYQDSLITVMMTSTETDADSIRGTLTYEVSGLTSPTTTQYSTAYTDTGSFSNLKPGGISRFYVRRYAGLARGLRFFWVENDTNKDASQTYTFQIIIPRQ
jgi:hypothetical protein